MRAGTGVGLGEGTAEGLRMHSGGAAAGAAAGGYLEEAWEGLLARRQRGWAGQGWGGGKEECGKGWGK